MSLQSEILKAEIGKLQIDLNPMIRRMEELKTARADALSREFIAANKITCADVEMSEGGKWFNDAWEFAEYLRLNSKKRWAEWNGRIYHTSDLTSGNMPDMPGRVEHLGKEEQP